jgi:hypothetical protein
MITTVCDPYAKPVNNVLGLWPITVTTKFIIAVGALFVSKRKLSKNHRSPDGRLQVTRKNSCVIVVGSRLHMLHSYWSIMWMAT